MAIDPKALLDIKFFELLDEDDRRALAGDPVESRFIVCATGLPGSAAASRFSA